MRKFPALTGPTLLTPQDETPSIASDKLWPAVTVELHFEPLSHLACLSTIVDRLLAAQPWRTGPSRHIGSMRHVREVKPQADLSSIHLLC
jgi:hypothetical protein